MNEVVWSLNILLGIGLIGVAYAIYYILKIATNELNVPIQNQEDHQNS